MNSDEKINILIVDDKPENLLALEAIIEREEYHLIKASSGEEALKFLLKYDFAAILLDVQMPGMDGFGTAKIIKTREKTKNIPILFITANNLESDHIFTGYSIGGIDYILKPFDPIILKAKVDGFVELYKLNQKLIGQAAALVEKNNELKKAYLQLSQATSELLLSEALANVISETSIDSMIIIDITGQILKVNPAVKQMFLYEEKEIIGQNISLLFSCEDSQKYIQNLLSAIKNLETIVGYENTKEISCIRKNGTLFPAELQIGKRYVQDQCIVACTIRDITNKKRYEEMITHMAYHDGLTELPNRRLFNEQLGKTLNHAKQSNQTFSLMYLDVDRFKYINDTLGHVVGDKILPEIGQVLKQSVRASDFVARIGGDEFSIILPNTNREVTLEIAEKILELFNQPLIIDNYELFLTMCIGISIFPYDGDDTIVLMKKADTALYRAKEQGRNKYKMFHSGMNMQSFRMFIMQNDLRKAIKREELTILYQPRIEVETGKITSAEAVLRWNHASWGVLSPSEFLPIVQEIDQLLEISNWILKTVCQQLRKWQEASIAPIRIAVPFSSQQFMQKDIMDTIHRNLNEFQISPTSLEIKVTQAVISKNETTINHIAAQFRKMGIRICIDDFGTGYSSVNDLRRFPIDFLEIDHTLIHDIENTQSNSTGLIATLISLAKTLNTSVIANGVETSRQLEILQTYHCQEIQGPLLSPPLSAENFKAFLIKNHSNQNPTAEISETISVRSSETPSSLVENEKILHIAIGRLKEIYTISDREMDVFKLIVDGLSNKEISEQLFISEHTVKNHITHILKKLEVNDRMQAMAMVYQTCIEEGKKLKN